MHLITALAAGVNGAEGGTAELKKRGTSTPASWYLTAEADGSASTATISLDAFGGASVYVTEYVDVTVRDSAGASVRTFTVMVAAADTEVRSLALNGTDYTTMAVAPGNPVDLSTGLGRWSDSAGTTVAGVKANDWRVVVDDAQTNLSAAFGPLTGTPVFNVRDSTYGATGDGTTDDTTAIAAAITAAAAAGGIVFLPPGDYRVTSTLAPTTCSIVGAGPSATTVSVDSSSTNGISFGASTYPVTCSGFRLEASQSTTGSLLGVTALTNLNVSDMWIDGTNCDSAVWVSTSAAVNVVIRDSVIIPGPNQDSIEASAHTGRLRITRVRFVTPATHNPSDAMVYGTGIDIRDCIFDLAASTAGTIECFESSSTTLSSSVTGCKFVSSGGATVTGIVLGTYVSGSVFAESANTMPGYLDTNFTAYSYTMSLATSTSVESQVRLATRDTRVLVLTHASTGTVTLADIMQYGHILVNNTSNGSVTYNVGLSGSVPPAGAATTIVVKADGAALTALDITGVTGAGSSHAVSINNRTNYHIVHATVTASLMSFTENY